MNATGTAQAADREGRSAFPRATLPIVLVGAMTATLSLTGPVDAAWALLERTPAKPQQPRPPARTQAEAQRTAPAAAVPPAPATYVVAAGDTVSGIAERFGLSTPAVLALNGLGWRSLIHPGQTLRLLPAVAAPPPAAAPAPTDAATGSYVIQRGDTMWGVAARFGVSTARLLAVNGLVSSSIIYPGQRIVVPGGTPMVRVSATTPAAGSAAARVPSPGPALSADAESNARTIIRVGRSLGVPEHGIVVALAAAAQESGLRNLPYGDRDSVGLFQQRPSTGWGTPAQLSDPAYAARLFYGGPTGPNLGRTRGLLDIPGWQDLSVTQAAQAVQISAFPDRYAQWETAARGWVARYS